MTDISIQAFSDMIAVDEECVLIKRLNDTTVVVEYVGKLEDCMDRFEEGTHNLVRKSDLQKEYDKQNLK